MFKIFNRDTEKHRLAKEGTVANIAERQKQKFNKHGTKKAKVNATAVQQTQINPNYKVLSGSKCFLRTTFQ